MAQRKRWTMVIAAVALLFSAPPGLSLAEEGVTDTQIKIGGVGDLSGPIAFMGKGVRDGALCYFKDVNDQGGVHGRKIDFIYEDDGYQAPRAVQACKKLITRDHVFCVFLVLGSAQSNAMYPLLASKKIPLVTPATQNRAMAIPPREYLFLADPTYTSQGKLAVEYIVEDMGVKDPKIACIYQDDTPGQDWERGVHIGAKHYGLKVLDLPYKRGATSFSSQVAKCKEAGITHVLMWTLVREPAMILKEAQRMNYKPVFITATPSMAKKALDLAGDAVDFSSGLYCTGMVNDPATESTAGLEEFKKNMAKYKIGDVNNFYCLYGYQAAKTLVEGLQRAGRDLTREGLIKALETFDNFDNGILAPITWGPDQRAGGSAVRMYQAKGGKWVPIGNWRFSKIKEQ